MYELQFAIKALPIEGKFCLWMIAIGVAVMLGLVAERLMETTGVVQ